MALDDLLFTVFESGGDVTPDFTDVGGGVPLLSPLDPVATGFPVDPSVGLGLPDITDFEFGESGFPDFVGGFDPFDVGPDKLLSAFTVDEDTGQVFTPTGQSAGFSDAQLVKAASDIEEFVSQGQAKGGNPNEPGFWKGLEKFMGTNLGRAATVLAFGGLGLAIPAFLGGAKVKIPDRPQSLRLGEQALAGALRGPAGPELERGLTAGFRAFGSTAELLERQAAEAGQALTEHAPGQRAIRAAALERVPSLVLPQPFIAPALARGAALGTAGQRILGI